MPRAAGIRQELAPVCRGRGNDRNRVLEIGYTKSVERFWE